MKSKNSVIKSKIIVLIFASVLFLIPVIYLLIPQSNSVEIRLKGEDPLAIRFALVDDEDNNALRMLAQAIIFPGSRQVLLYFQNTDAIYLDDPEKIFRKSPSSADRFEKFTNYKSEYFVTITKTNAIRLFNLLEGMPFFLDDPVYFKNSMFQYPAGMRNFSGEQLMEYALGKEVRKGEHDRFFDSINRMHRIESVFMNALWRLTNFSKKIEDPRLMQFAFSLADSNFSLREFGSLASYFRGEAYVNLREVPLQVIERDENTAVSALVVNIAGAEHIFSEFQKKLNAGSLVLEIFSLEILNGTMRQGLAQRLKQFMDDQSFLILSVSNFNYKPLKKTVILERSGNTLSPHLLIRKTSLSRDRVFFLRKNSQVDTILGIGEDFDFKNIKLN